MTDQDMEALADHIQQKERRLVTLEMEVKALKEFCSDLRKDLQEMTNWFKGMVFSIFGGVVVAIVLTFLKVHGG